jgi:hypothetical protein
VRLTASMPCRYLQGKALGVLGVKLESYPELYRPRPPRCLSLHFPPFHSTVEVTLASFCLKVRIVQKSIPPTDLVVNVKAPLSSLPELSAVNHLDPLP